MGSSIDGVHNQGLIAYWQLRIEDYLRFICHFSWNGLAYFDGQNGLAYFDGQNGLAFFDGRNGVAYFDGQNGLAYFDGQNGKTVNNE